MANRCAIIAVVFLAVSMLLAGCGGGGGQTQGPAQRAQGSFTGTVHSASHPNVVKCELTISGSVVTGTLQTADGTVVGTVNGTIDEDGSIDVNYEFDGDAQGENDTLEVNDDNGHISIQSDDSDEGPEDDSTDIDLDQE